MKKILFVCTGNTCRSPMAEAFFNDKVKKLGIGEKFLGNSAGIFVVAGSSKPSSLATEVMNESFKIDISNHVPKPLDIEIIKESYLILCMESAMAVYLRQNLHILNIDSSVKIDSLKTYVGKSGDVRDPFGGDKTTYSDTAVEIKELIDLTLEKLINEENK